MLREICFELKIFMQQLKHHLKRMRYPSFIQSNQSRNTRNRLQTNSNIIHFTREIHTKREHLEIIYQRQSTRRCLRHQRQDRIQREILVMIQHEQFH